MPNVLGVTEVSEKDLTEEEKEAIVNGDDILSDRVIPFAKLSDDALQSIYEYSGYEYVLKIRPDWIVKYHPEHLH